MSRDIMVSTDGDAALETRALDSVSGGLNALMLPLGAVMATLAALDRDEFWIPYFTGKIIEADK